MRTQELRPGFSSSSRQGEEERDAQQSRLRLVPPADVTIDLPAPASELDERRWSVVSTGHVEASEQTYRDAVELMSLLEAHGIRGLRIVSDEAVNRAFGADQ